MNRQEKLLANEAIEENVKDSTARKIIQWVMECEINGFDTEYPTNQYFAEKFGWNLNTARVAVSKANQSGFITITGRGKYRTFELNVQFLKGKMAEILARRPKKKDLDFSFVAKFPEQ